MICSALFWENEAVYNPECSPGKQQFQPESSPQTHRLFIAASADYYSTVTDSFLVYKMSENSKKKNVHHSFSKSDVMVLHVLFYLTSSPEPKDSVQYDMNLREAKKSPYLTG